MNSCPRILISAAHKSSGKTTVSIGLCAALSRDSRVQPYKKGPDYIDPMWLGMASGRDCYNLDFYTMPKAEIMSTLACHSQDADISIIEGNKGLYDGLDLDGSNSNAALASLLGAPVVLVIDARGMTRGIAPLILGYQAFDPHIHIAGVILNQLGGKRHESKLRQVIEHYTDVRVIGSVYRKPELEIEERHLGLIPSNEDGYADKKIRSIGNYIAGQVDIDLIRQIAATAAPCPVECQPLSQDLSVDKLRIGVVKNEAFGFYYPGDLHALEQAGADIVPVDTITEDHLPQLDGLFIDGGFPESRMQQLEDNSGMRASIRQAVQDGLPVYAECGGLMYLSRQLEWQGKTCQMVGAIPGDTVMESKPQGRGYIIIRPTEQHPWHSSDSDNAVIAGHEFHYSRLVNLDPDLRYAYSMERGTGIDGKHDGIVINNMLACYSHLRDTDNYHWARNFIAHIRRTRKNHGDNT